MQVSLATHSQFEHSSSTVLKEVHSLVCMLKCVDLPTAFFSLAVSARMLKRVYLPIAFFSLDVSARICTLMYSCSTLSNDPFACSQKYATSLGIGTKATRV